VCVCTFGDPAHANADNTHTPCHARPVTAAGKATRVLPSPRVTRGSALGRGAPNPTRLCGSRAVDFTVTLGPFNRSSCGINSQVRVGV
jgi:hypothetical protein